MKIIIKRGLAFLLGVVVLSAMLILWRHRTHKINQESLDGSILELLGNVRLLLPVAKERLSKGVDFKARVNGLDVSGERWTMPNPEDDPKTQLSYWINSNEAELYKGLTGLLVLHKKDATHVDVVFRSGALQFDLSPIAICIDDYDIGTIDWEGGK